MPERYRPHMEESANDASKPGPTLPTVTEEPAAVTPSPGIALREVLRSRVLRGSKVLAGAQGLDRRVARLNVMEVPDILAWVRPGELLLTTGYPLRHRPEDLATLVEELDRRGVAALGIKVGRYLGSIPGAVLARADCLGFPVVALPEDVSFDDVLTEVLGDLINTQAALLARAEQVHRTLVDIVLTGGGVPQVAAGLAVALDGAVLVTTPDGRVLASAGEGSELERALGGPWMDGSGRFRTESDDAAIGAHADDDGGGHAVVAVAAGQLDHGRIVVCSAQGRPTDADVHALERAATVCALAVTRDLAVAAVEGRYQADFLRDVLLGRGGSPQRVVAHAAGLGWDVERRMVVVVAEPDELTPEQVRERGVPEVRGLTARPVVDRLAAAWAGVVRARDPQAAVAGFSTEVVALVGVGESVDGERVVRDMVAGVRGDGGGGRRPFTTGVSRPVAGATGIAAAYEQARTAVRVGRQVNGGGSLTHFDRLGVYRLLSLVPDSAELRAFVAEVLGPLAGDDDEALDLRRTLEVLLDTNLNVAETARRLHFHYNTLRYRIGKLERLLGPFTEDPHLRLDLALALRVVSMRGMSGRS